LADEPILTVRGLSIGYEGRVVLQDIDFDVHRGEVFVVLGGSGCGKSTLLRTMIGLIEPIGGSVKVDGVEFLGAEGPARQAVLKKFGVLYQSSALFSSMTLVENVALPLEEFTTLPKDAIQFIARTKLRLVGLAGYEDHLPAAISGGMRKRAGVARALALDPRVLFLDEPSAGLDPITSAELDRLVLSLRDALGTTMVVVTHELPSIYAIADRCIVLEKKRHTIVARGKPAELRDTSTDPYVRAFFRRTTMADEHASAQAIAERAGAVRDSGAGVAGGDFGSSRIDDQREEMRDVR
jgi:phospholipid/cholesterol/gamma-HCH transport system ATP-binding protein